ncbi:hypothetical protein Pla111_10520 [Botrimarina hoheduenensis]|uniref:Uncharacterized protein n=2 Tax=Botrimarina hoheduenensis TaxID=2528000 RepID=A0A5C5W978_9BACT|nr:hypothetical protein Pla111_10520 [Botrimarina hoheduenensis]
MVGGLTLLGGCSPAVEYEGANPGDAAAATNDATEAPAFDPGESASEGTAPVETPPDTSGLAEEVNAPTPEESSSAGLVPRDPPPLPWQSETPAGPASAKAQQLFSDVEADADEPAETSEAAPLVGDRYAAAPDTTPAEEDDGFDASLDFMERELGVAPEASPGEETASLPPEPEPEPEFAFEPPSEPPSSEADTVTSDQVDAKSPPSYGNPPPFDDPPAPAAKELEDNLSGLEIGPLSRPGVRDAKAPQPEPVVESSAAPVDREPSQAVPPPIVAEAGPNEEPLPVERLLWEPIPTPETNGLAEGELPPEETFTLPDLDEVPTTDAAREELPPAIVSAPVARDTAEPAPGFDPFDDPKSDAASAETSRYSAPPLADSPATGSVVAEPSATEPSATEPSATEPSVTEPPVTEPPVTEPPVAEPAVTAPATAARMSSREPLPALPVLPYNTRHLSWLLGAKLGLAQLAGAEGATDDEVRLWSEESNRLLKQLKLSAVAPPAVGSSATTRLQQLLSSAEKLGDQIAAVHGPDHAALFEIALKTNALLALFDERPALAGPVARATTAAAERAVIPGRLWRDAARRIEYAQSRQEAFDAVTQLHAEVEAYLR